MKFKIRRASGLNLGIKKLSEAVKVLSYEEDDSEKWSGSNAEIEVNSLDELEKISRLYDDELIVRFGFLRYASDGNEIMVYDDYVE